MLRLFVRLVLLTIALGGLARAERKVLILGPVDVPGRPPRPEVTIFVTRQNLDAPLELVLAESFIPRIVESAGRLPGELRPGERP